MANNGHHLIPRARRVAENLGKPRVDERQCARAEEEVADIVGRVGAYLEAVVGGGVGQMIAGRQEGSTRVPVRPMDAAEVMHADCMLIAC